MTEDGLRRVEAELGPTPPGDYRRRLPAFPFTPVGGDRAYWLYDDPGDVIRATRSPLNEFYGGLSWRPTYIAVEVVPPQTRPSDSGTEVGPTVKRDASGEWSPGAV